MNSEMIIKETKIPHQNRTVSGILYIPKTTKKCPIVIFSHGYNGCKSDFELHAKYLVENDIAAFCIPEDWNRRFPGEADIPEEEELWGMKLGRVFFESIRGYDVFEHVGKYSNAVLVLHGDKDSIVELEYSERIARTYSKVSLAVFLGEGHGFTPEGDRKVMEMVRDFVRTERV